MEDQGMEPMEPIPCLDLNDGYLTPQREEPELEPQHSKAFYFSFEFWFIVASHQKTHVLPYDLNLGLC